MWLRVFIVIERTSVYSVHALKNSSHCFCLTCLRSTRGIQVTAREDLVILWRHLLLRSLGRRLTKDPDQPEASPPSTLWTVVLLSTAHITLKEDCKHPHYKGEKRDTNFLELRSTGTVACWMITKMDVFFSITFNKKTTGARRHFKSVFLGLYSSYCFLHSLVTCLNEVSLYFFIMCLQPVKLPWCCFDLAVNWCMRSWLGRTSSPRLTVPFLLLGIWRVVLFVDVQWQFLEKVSINKWN